MFYLGIDQHRKQLTVCLRDSGGDVVLRRQVSTQWERVREFLSQLREQTDSGYVAIIEVCGFNDLAAGDAGRIQLPRDCLDSA